MKIISEKSVVHGEILVPASKSHTIRAVAIASMAEGKSIIINPLCSGDTLSSLNAAEALGAEIEKKNDFWRIKGTAGKFKSCHKTIDLGNSGTSLRLFTAIASLAEEKYSFDGDSSLRTREMRPLLGALEQIGAKTTSTNGKCPLSVQGPIKGGKISLEAKSSQFLSALLFACPLAKNKSQIELTLLNEKPYVEITLDWLRKQHIELEHNKDLMYFSIPGRQAYKKFEQAVPADFSTATFPLVAAAITGGEIKIKNLDFSDKQGDKEVFSMMKQMGVKVEQNNSWTIVKGPKKLSAATFDLNATPDALPAMAVAAIFAEGCSKLLNVPQARIKETDRISCMACELRKMGAKIEELPDGMIIEGGYPIKGVELDGHGDHRIVMALAIAGLAAEGKTIVNGSEAAAVTYPNFVIDFQNLNAKLRELS